MSPAAMTLPDPPRGYDAPPGISAEQETLTMKTTMLCGALTLAFALSACGSDDGNNNNNSVLKVQGTVTCPGATCTGSLIVSASTIANPTCPNDVPERYKIDNSPSFPYAYELKPVPAGDYYLAAFLNVNPTGSIVDCPEAVDVCGHTTTPVTIDAANPTATIDVALDVVGCGQ
jgi:hypothetical protein